MRIGIFSILFRDFSISRGPQKKSILNVYLTHAHNHITRAVAAMDSCFALVGAHQHGIAVGSKHSENPCISETSLHEKSYKSLVQTGYDSTSSQGRFSPPLEVEVG